MSIKERLYPMFSIAPDAGAVEYNGRWFSWGQLKTLVDALESRLAEAALPAGTPIGLLCRNQPEHVGAVVGVICAGHCLVPINPFAAAEKVCADVVELNLPVLVAAAGDWQLPGLEELARARGMVMLSLDGSGVTVLEAKLTRPASEYREPVCGTAIEMLSSGTTGKPKRIRLAATNLERGLVAKPRIVDGKPELAAKPGLVSAPLVHISGIFWALNHMAEGRGSILLDRFSVASWVQAVKRHRLRYAGLVPTGIKMLLDADVPREDLASLLAVRSGTAPLAPGLQRAFEQKYGIPILNQYGATEFAGAVIGWTLEQRKQYPESKPGSVGRPLPHVEIKVIDQVSGQPVAAGETGLLCVKAPQLGGQEWVKTTDLASVDIHGFVWIRGRADHAIIRGGFKIVPSEIVDVLETHPSIRNASIVGLPHERLGEIPVAAVELRPDASTTPEELRAWSRTKLTSYFVPVDFKIVASLPRTPSLKVSEPAVKALFDPRDYENA